MATEWVCNQFIDNIRMDGWTEAAAGWLINICRWENASDGPPPGPSSWRCEDVAQRGRGYEAGPVGRGPKASSPVRGPPPFGLCCSSQWKLSTTAESRDVVKETRARAEVDLWNRGRGRRREHPTGGSDAGLLGYMTVSELRDGLSPQVNSLLEARR